MSLESAVAVAFGEETLRFAHGPSLRLTSWRADGETKQNRQIQFKIDVAHIPPTIRRFFCGKHLRVTAKQRMHSSNAQVDVENKLKMHFVGSELFKVRPRFQLSSEKGFVYLSGCVEHHAMLPNPIGVVAERFMASNTENELEKYGAAIKRLLKSQSKQNGCE